MGVVMFVTEGLLVLMLMAYVSGRGIGTQVYRPESFWTTSVYEQPPNYRYRMRYPFSRDFPESDDGDNFFTEDTEAQVHWFQPPTLRGKRFPATMGADKVKKVTLPWNMMFFSPMLRG